MRKYWAAFATVLLASFGATGVRMHDDVQALSTTRGHGHIALFVYGVLGLGLILFFMRALRATALWSDRLLAVAFGVMNVGLSAMVVIGVLPVGLAQPSPSVDHALGWLRVPGDTLVAVAVVAIVGLVAGLGDGVSQRTSLTASATIASASRSVTRPIQDAARR